RTKELSATEIEQALKLSEEAREQSGPLLENFKKNAEDLAKQAIDKAKELRQRAQEDADNKDKKQQ
ncbi:MAG: hypothetical protein H7X92_09035, partial [Chitinophagales bacterium]|nr:hypothetical protein [Hyphomicrobiales bacterium]